MLSASGCQSGDSSELELLKRDDPGFRNLIEMQDQMEQRVAELKRDMSVQKELADAKIKKIKDQLDAESEIQKKLIEEIHNKMAETKDAFSDDVHQTSETLAAKNELESKLSSALDHATKILSQSETLGLTDQEVADWQGRIQSLTDRLTTVKSELIELKAQESLKRKKLKYL